MLGIGNYLWRLLPANPILLRVVAMAGRRRRDLIFRTGYLAVLILAVSITIIGSQTSGGDLAALAKISGRLLVNISWLQLALVALLAPVFMAGAISEQRNAQSLDLLLASPLTNEQIVLGGYLSRLFFVLTLLLSGIPIFSITQIFGGVAISDILNVLWICAATAVVCGGLAIFMATINLAPRSALFSFYLLIALYLVGGVLLDQSSAMAVAGEPTLLHPQTRISWLTGINPFLAMRVVLHDPLYRPPTAAALGDKGWLVRWYLGSPQTFYPVFMVLVSALLLIPSVLTLRRWAQSTWSLRGWILRRLRLRPGVARRKPRSVWHNPIAWREARTRGGSAGSLAGRFGFAAIGLVLTIWVLRGYHCTLPMSRWVDRFSYDAATDSITINSDKGIENFLVSPHTTISLDNRPIAAEKLTNPYQVLETTVPPARRNELATLKLSSQPRQFSATEAGSILALFTQAELALVLLLVANTAASAVTREKEDGTLDLLLATPITSRYYIWGKLRGLVSQAAPLMGVPVAGLLIFLGYDVLAHLGGQSGPWVVHPEALVLLPLLLVATAAATAMIGMSLSLRCRKTVVAVMATIGLLVGALIILGFFGNLMLWAPGANDTQRFFAAFSPFALVQLLFIQPAGGTGEHFSRRMFVIVGALVANALILAGVWLLYRSMVHNFDMTIRRQSR